MTRTIVAIDGIDGSGKSHLASELQRVARAAGYDSVLVTIDDFRRPIQWQQPGLDELAAYYDDYYDFANVRACLDAYSAGQTSFTTPAFDSVSERLCGDHTIEFNNAGLLVLEGVFAARVLESRLATWVYLKTSESEAGRRILRRDELKGRSVEDVSRRISQRYFPAQRHYRDQFRPEERADIVLEHESVGETTIIRAKSEQLHPALSQFLHPFPLR